MHSNIYQPVRFNLCMMVDAIMLYILLLVYHFM